jgi:hypothetical protein
VTEEQASKIEMSEQLGCMKDAAGRSARLPGQRGPAGWRRPPVWGLSWPTRLDKHLPVVEGEGPVDGARITEKPRKTSCRRKFAPQLFSEMSIMSRGSRIQHELFGEFSRGGAGATPNVRT